MTAKRREDIVVSLCLVSETSEALDIEELRRIADTLTARYRYWEMLIAVHAEVADDHENLLATVHNLRLLRLRKGVPFYRSRAAVASEAIGDVVVLTAATELSAFDLVDLIDGCDAQGTIIIGRRRRKELMNPALISLGRSAGFRVDGRDMLTAAFPRALLQQVLAHPESQLALRFPPVDYGIPVQWRFSQARNRQERSYPKLGRRLGLVHKLIVSSAPRVLTLVSFLSLGVMLLAGAFGIYAIIAWLTVDDVQPGWFTTSAIQSLTATFLACAIFGLSIGIQKIVETMTNDTSEDIVGERSSVDMFGHVFHDLNVSIEHRDEAPSDPIQNENARRKYG